MARILPAELEEASVEFGVYLFESIGKLFILFFKKILISNNSQHAWIIMRTGNATRIDYGTGHELAFVQLLYCGVSDNDVSCVLSRTLTTLIGTCGCVHSRRRSNQ